MNRAKRKEVNKERVYFFDTMRAMLIIFIVTIHTLQVFNPNASWLIDHNNNINIAPFLIDFLMLFTLQSFFIMSGYLAAMSIKNIGVKNFFDSRIKRILIPIIVTAITLNSLQTYFLTKSSGIDINIYTYIIKGEWVSHLWFLIDIAIFFLFSYIAVVFFNSIIKKINYFFNLLFEKFGLYIMLLFISFLILILIMLFSILSPYIYNEIINIKSLFFYSPFFILGTLLFSNQKIFKNFIKMPILNTLLISIIFSYLSIYFLECTNNIEKIAYNFFNASSNLFASALCFTLFYKFFNKESKFFSFLAEASYSIYLFHHVLVVLGGLILIKLNIGGYLGFFILLLFVSALSLSIHHYLISKVNFLALLYNGKKLKKNKYV